MDLEAIYENVECRDIQNTTRPQTQSQSQDEGKDLKSRGSRCLVLITVSLGLICGLLLIFIILQHITIRAERDTIKSYKNTVEEFNQTINSLEDNYTDLMIEKHQLQNNFNSLSQKKLELETRVRDLTAEKSQLQNNFNSLSQKKLELETRVRDLTAEKSQLQNNFNSLSQKKLELETRVRDLTAEKSQLQNNFNSLSQKKLELETRVRDLTAEKSQLQSNYNFLNQKKLELESGQPKKESKQVCFFISNEEKSWPDSRQYCRDRGADLVIINTEEKQRFISSYMKDVDRAWIGLSDVEQEGKMKWVNNSPLKQGFWYEGEPNDRTDGNEDCIEMMASNPILNWNDLPCSEKRKGVCEK